MYGSSDGADGAVGRHGFDAVVIVGLKSAAHLNGTVGFLETPLDPDTGRMGVRTHYEKPVDMPRKGPCAATISNSRQGYLLGLKPENARGLAATRAAGLMPWGLTQSSWCGPTSIEGDPDSPKLAEVMATFPSPSACYARAWVIFQAMHGVENFSPTNQVTFGLNKESDGLLFEVSANTMRPPSYPGDPYDDDDHFELHDNDPAEGEDEEEWDRVDAMHALAQLAGMHSHAPHWLLHCEVNDGVGRAAYRVQGSKGCVSRFTV